MIFETRRDEAQRWVILCVAVLLLAASLIDLAGIPVLGTLPFPVFLLTSALIAVASWLLVSSYGGESPLDLALIDAGLIGLATIAGLGLILGSAGWLSFRGLASGSALVAVGSVFLVQPSIREHQREAAPTDPDKPLLRLPASMLEFSVLLGVAILLSIAAFAMVQGVGGRIFRPPVGDPLAYHLPFAVEWLQTGKLSMPVPAAGDPSTPFYPLNSSLWIFWLLAPFENEALARVVQAPFLILLFLSTLRLSREIGLRWEPAVAAAALAVTVPDIARSASLAENDLILAALLLAATAQLARLWNQPTIWRAALTALPLGLIAGTKVLAVPFAGVLGIAFIIVVVRSCGLSALAKVGGLSVALVVTFGSYSYVRNLIVMHNPLYPAGYVIFGRDLFSGLYIVTREWRRNHAFYPFDWPAFFLHSRRTFGYMVTLWAVPGMALAAVGIVITSWRELNRQRIRELRDSGWFAPVALFIWVPAALAIFWFIIPYHFARFLYPTVVWGIVVATWGFSWFVRQMNERFATLVVIAAAIPFATVNMRNTPLNPAIRSTLRYWLTAGLLLACIAVGWWFGTQLRYEQVRRGLMIGVAGVALASMIVWPTFERRYEDRRYSEWRQQIQGFSQIVDAWEWVDQQTKNEPAVISVAGTNDSYPLYGADLDNQIVTIWHSGELAKYSWSNPYHYFGTPDPTKWSKQIEDAGVDYIFMTQDVSFGGWPVERAWIENNPQRFNLVFQNNDATIWRVR